MECHAFRDALIEAAGLAAFVGGMRGDGDLAQETRAHLASCASCSAAWKTWLAQARALGSLERREAPRDLDGRVVASLHAGHLQSRAAAEVAGLSRLSTPPGLDELVRQHANEPFVARSAPETLDQLVRESVEDPAYLSQNMTAKLGRQSAPTDLDDHVERLSARAAGARRRSWARVGLGTLAAALLLVWATGMRDEAPEGPRYDFEIVRCNSIDELDVTPFQRAALDGLTGGVLEAAQ